MIGKYWIMVQTGHTSPSLRPFLTASLDTEVG